ncbi:MAG: sigma-70 family RNA polymerase sigma factor [Acidobacteriia bacterium]|nr:sigma-70 family RNA polymerase sigma factor [Terriglobia bacterium]
MSTAQCLPLHQFDASYISKLGARDSEVEAHFAWYFSHFMTGSLRRRAASTERINDIRQETFARVLAAVHSDQGIRRPECFGAFVASVCRNVLYESYRSDRFEPLDDMPPQLSDPVGSPEAMYTAFEVRKQVRGVLRQMPNDEEMLLRAVYLEERDRDEVCRELGISRGYLRVLLHRAKQQFRARFTKTANTRPEAQRSKARTRPVRSSKPGMNAACQRVDRGTRAQVKTPLIVIQGGRSLAVAAHA